MEYDRKQTALFEVGCDSAAYVQEYRAGRRGQVRDDRYRATALDDKQPVGFPGRTGDADGIKKIQVAKCVR